MEQVEQAFVCPMTECNLKRVRPIRQVRFSSTWESQSCFWPDSSFKANAKSKVSPKWWSVPRSKDHRRVSEYLYAAQKINYNARE